MKTDLRKYVWKPTGQKSVFSLRKVTHLFMFINIYIIVKITVKDGGKE